MERIGDEMPKFKVQGTVEQNVILTVEADSIDAARALVENETRYGLGNVKANVTIHDAWECTFGEWERREM